MAKARAVKAPRRPNTSVLDLLRSALDGRLTLVEQLQNREPISYADAVWLSQQPLGTLLGLIEVSFARTTPLARPVVFCSLSPILEGGETALDECITRIDRLKGQHSETLTLACEGWSDLDQRLAVLQRLKRETGVQPLGPSTGEMRSLALKPEKILSALKRAGIKTVPGGASLEVHLLAAKRGFSLHVAHDVTPLLGGGGVGTQPLYPLESDPESVKLLFERFVAELLEVRDTLSATGNLTLWFPWTTQPLDTPHSILPTPLRALRILALARLLLPAVPFISAPLTLFGPSLTTLALSFGANDLGSLAADAATATALKIARYSEGVQVLQEWERRAGG